MASVAYNLSDRTLRAAIGMSPMRPIPVSARPVSFAAALADFKCAQAQAAKVEACASEKTVRHDRLEDALDATVTDMLDAMDHMLSVPARTQRDLLAKLEAVYLHGDIAEYGATLIRDAKRLAGAK